MQNSDQNLLYGILALQLDFIDKDQLVTAMQAWVLDKKKSLGEILVDNGHLKPQRRVVLDNLLEEHLAEHGHDVRKSLASLHPTAGVHEELQSIADRQLTQSLVHVSESPSPMATAPPTMGGATSEGRRFQILRPLSQGGLGKVSVAQDNELHREVALKEILPRMADIMESRNRFMLEAEVTGGLEHPGIVPVYGLGQAADGRPYYAHAPDPR